MDASTIKVFQQFHIPINMDSTDTAGREVEGRVLYQPWKWDVSATRQTASLQGRQVVTKTVKKLKKIRKSWVLLQKYPLKEAIPFLVLTAKASRKQSRIIFSQ